VFATALIVDLTALNDASTAARNVSDFLYAMTSAAPRAAIAVAAATNGFASIATRSAVNAPVNPVTPPDTAAIAAVIAVAALNATNPAVAAPTTVVNADSAVRL
jgi:hypothetical protein